MTASLAPRTPPSATALLDDLMETADGAAAVAVIVDAPAAATYAALKRVDFARMPERDPVMRWLIAARALPDAISRRLHGQSPEVAIAEAGARLSDMSDGPDAWIRLAEIPGAEFAFGAIGQFLGAQVNWRRTRADEFAAFAEPGYVKIAASLSVHPYGDRRCVLVYDCRSSATDEATRRGFRRYWRLLSAGIRLVMRRAAAAIQQEARSRP